jgi:DNA-binding HxlR family transcriptional regulator
MRDQKCSIILKTIVLKRDGIGFNQLCNCLKESGVKGISRPTLSDHLKHLLKDKYIIRIPNGTQRIVYRFNTDHLEESGKRIMLLTKMNVKWIIEEAYNFEGESGKHFYGEDIKDILALKSLLSLRLKIMQTLEPEKAKDYALAELINDELAFKNIDDDIIEFCRKDEGFLKDVLDYIKTYEESFNI